MKDLEGFLDKIEKVLEENPKYRFEAYSFVLAGLHHTTGKLKQPRHVTGAELLEGIRQYALQQYGPMARTVLEYWGITATEDFGRIVFALVNVGVLRKQPQDRIEDFIGVYEFDEAFDRGYAISDEES